MPPCVPITPDLYPRNRLAISKHAGWTTQWSKIAHVTGQNSGNSSTVWPKTHYGKRWTLKSRWCNRGTTMANAEKKSQPVHHVNMFAQQHLEYNMLHGTYLHLMRLCGDGWQRVDSKWLLLAYAGLSWPAVICADTRFLPTMTQWNCSWHWIKTDHHTYILYLYSWLMFVCVQAHSILVSRLSSFPSMLLWGLPVLSWRLMGYHHATV